MSLKNNNKNNTTQKYYTSQETQKDIRMFLL